MAKATIAVPAGLDSLTPDEQKMMDAMRDDAPIAEPALDPEPSPAPDPTPAPADEAPEAHDEPAADPKNRTVPQQALHAERERRKGVEGKLAAAEIKFAADQARAQERLDILAAAVAAAAPAAAAPASVVQVEIPDVNTDPVGHFRALADQQTRRVENLEAIVRGEQEGRQQQNAATDLRNWAGAQERAFAAQEPAYPDAMKWLTESRNNELEKIGITDPAERQRIIGSDVNAIAQKARKDGADFAARLYGAAEARGYKKAAPAAVADPALAAIPALDAPAVRPDAAARIEEGRQNSITLGSLGSAPATKLSVQKIADMSEKEFGALVKNLSPAALRELMGN